MIQFNEEGMRNCLLEEKNILHDKKGGIEILISESDSIAQSQSYIGGKQGLVLGLIDKREENPFSYVLEFSNNTNSGTLNGIEQHGKFPKYFAGMEETFFHDYGEKIKFTTGIKYMDLTRTKIIATASPEYISTHEKINKPKDLLGHYLLHEAHYEPWKEWLKAQGIQQDIEFTGPKLWQSHLTLDSARHGRGIALTNYLVVAEDLKKGDLLEVGAGLESFSIQNYGIYLFMTWASRWNETSIRRYRQWLKKTITTDLASIGTGSTK